MDIDNYNILLYECKNGHSFNYILIDEFEEKQKINISKIKCDKCEIIKLKHLIIYFIYAMIVK